LLPAAGMPVKIVEIFLKIFAGSEICVKIDYQ